MTETISSVQSYALFDILTHHESFAEIRALRLLETIENFGGPLEKDIDNPSTPLIQLLLNRFVLVLPGLRDVPLDFWQRRIQDLFGALASADLSESYDKGSIGIRKTLSTAVAAMMEFCARGFLGGCPRRNGSTAEHTYNSADPNDVAAAWDDFLQQVVYGDLIDRMFEKASKTDQLTDHESLVQATHEYIFVMCELFSQLHCIL